MPELNKSQAIRDCFTANPTAKAQEVVDALAKKGITVTTGLVRIVKSKHNQRQAAKKAARTAGGVSAKTTTTTTTTDNKPEVSKTQAVRDYLKANKKAKNKEVVEALGNAGHHDHCQLRREHQGHEEQAAAGGKDGRCRSWHRYPRSQSCPGFH